MCFRSTRFLPALAATLAFALATPSLAQQRRGEPLRMSGTLAGMQGRILQVENEKGEKWLVSVESREPAKDIEFTAEASKEWLRPGMLVRVTARCNHRKSTILDPIQEIEVVSLREGMTLGMNLENPPGPGEGLFSEAGPARRPMKIPDEASFILVGKIAQIKDEKIVIAAGKALKGEMAENCKVSVNLAELSFANKGDKVTLEGTYNPASQGYGSASKVTVVAAAKLEPPAAPTRGGRKPGSPAGESPASPAKPEAPGEAAKKP